ncbi:MAG: cob(I)yrinic acid a,c-diamide adenosyltransferase [Phycisphaerae bacterium]|nr:cob(I)yrinic acid a,c-diamide adenosyltransferase [Phycisphaerae bacterium]
MRLYTRGGDAGMTSLFDGSRVPKDDPRVEAYGGLDELGSLLGWCRCGEIEADLADRLARVQDDLLTLGAELAMPGQTRSAAGIRLLPDEAITRLEGWIDEAVDRTPPLRQFILPGGSDASARLHVARTCCRRAERGVVSLRRIADVRELVIIYLNRLGDLLFAWARQANAADGIPDVSWTPPRTRESEERP